MSLEDIFIEIALN